MGPLLETKLRIPSVRAGNVERSRLSDHLGRGAVSALTLISAPAGFGKTTLLTGWLTGWLTGAAAHGQRVAWLSLDERDNDPTSFWSYLATALRVAGPGVGAEALGLLQPPPAPVDAVVGSLINDLHAASTDVVLVLDDYHVIDSPAIHDGLAFLLEHRPPQLRLVIASRTDPTLPLARLRARGELVEIRAADLRFTAEEASAYLTGMLGIALTAHDVGVLEERTEGWIAALQLAALSMQGRDDVPAFIAGFAGDDRYIVDYLAEEVLQRQSDDVRRFLMRTSVLDRFSGPLCDAVTGQTGGKARLVALDRDNLFLIPLDDRRQWYRYHQLFADVLRAHLLDEEPDLVETLHRRASAWYAGAADPSEAIRHALAGHDFDRAAELVERAIPAIRKERREVTVRDWLLALPPDVVRSRPVLNVGLAGALLASGTIDGVEQRLHETELQLAALPDDTAAGLALDTDELRLVPAMIELYRAALSLAFGDVHGTVTHAQQALDRSTEDDHLCRAAAAGLLGIAFWARGDLEVAYRSWSQSVAGLHRAGHLADTLGCTVALGDIRRTQGRLVDALRTYEQALALAAGIDGAALRGTADMYVGMSEIVRERGDIAAATSLLERAQQLGDYNGLPQNRYRWRVAMSRVREAEGDLAAALDLLEQAERTYVGDFFPRVRPIAAMRARLQVRRGDLDAARAWVREQKLSADDELSYLREYEHVTLARVLLASRGATAGDGTDDAVTSFLERLLAAADEGGRRGSVVELLVLQALDLQARHDLPGARAALGRALAMARSEGYLRVFVDEGAPLMSLLDDLSSSADAGDDARRIVAHLTPEGRRTPNASGLVDPLSERELEVLRLLGTDLDGPAIARHLVVSLSTVRSHTKNIYAKLGVNSRRAAVRRGDELGLLRHG